MQKEMSGMINDYQTDMYQEGIRNETMSMISDQFQNTVRDIDRLRQGLETTMDGMNILIVRPN